MSDERGLANWPAMRPIFTTGMPPPKVSTTAICRMHAQRVADLVGLEVGEGLGAVAALEQEGLAGADLGQPLLQRARLAGEDQRRVARELALDLGQSRGVGIVRHLLDGAAAPGIGLPVACHRSRPSRLETAA